MANLPGYSLARRLAAGETVYTGWCALPAPIVAESIAREGFNTVTIDQQHGLWDTAATAVAIASIRAAGAAPIVRIPLGAFAVASRSLDFGAEGIIAPMINTVADAKAFVGAAKFPPLGERSWGPTRAMTLAGISDPKQYLNEANAATVTLAMIETKTAMANLDAIAAVPGIDVLFVGPSDLSIGLTDGKELDPHSATVDKALDQDRRGLQQGRQDRRPLLRQRRARGRLRQARRPLHGRRQRSRLPARRHRGAAQGAEGLTADAARFVEHLADIRLDLRHRHVDHAIAALGEIAPPLGARGDRGRGLVGGHQLDRHPQRKRHHVGDVRPDRHLALEAVADEAPVAHESVPELALGLGRIAAQQPRQPAHRTALVRHLAGVVLGQQRAQQRRLVAVEQPAPRRALAAFRDRRDDAVQGADVLLGRAPCG